MSNPKSLRAIVAEQSAVLAMLTAELSKLTAVAPPAVAPPMTLTGKAKAPKAKKTRVFPPLVCKVQRNTEMGGIEYLFGGPIEKEVSTFVKSLGMRFNSHTKAWYTAPKPTPAQYEARFAELSAVASKINAGILSR